MKGIQYLLQAACHLQNEAIPFQIKIAGEGSLRDELQHQAGVLGVAERIEFLGHITKMRAFYSSINVFILPSISTEGLPLSVLEAMAMGLPIIATSIGGTGEAVRHGIDGVLCPPQDSNALAAAMRSMLLDHESVLEMAIQARQRVAQHFCIQRVIDEVERVYEELLMDLTRGPRASTVRDESICR
jgi:glycosyltransferase involved in cell wall biosynthesis